MTIVCHPDRAKRAEGSPVLASPFCPRCGPKGEVPKPSGEAVGVMQKVAPLISPVPGGFGQLPPQGEGKRGMFSLWGISHFVRNDNSVSSRPSEASGGIPCPCLPLLPAVRAKGGGGGAEAFRRGGGGYAKSGAPHQSCAWRLRTASPPRGRQERNVFSLGDFSLRSK